MNCANTFEAFMNVWMVATIRSSFRLHPSELNYFLSNLFVVRWIDLNGSLLSRFSFELYLFTLVLIVQQKYIKSQYILENAIYVRLAAFEFGAKNSGYIPTKKSYAGPSICTRSTFDTLRTINPSFFASASVDYHYSLFEISYSIISGFAIAVQIRVNMHLVY